MVWSTCNPLIQIARELREWYRREPGLWVHEAERELLESAVQDLFGYHILQIGLSQHECLHSSRIPFRVVMDMDFEAPKPAALISDSAYGRTACVNGMPELLPFAADSLDVLMLLHTLEFCQNPHQVLREADRTLIPEGHVVILGFNPWGLWAVWRYWGLILRIFKKMLQTK